MVKLIAMYRQPEDKAAFDHHYTNVHLPLAKKMPGLQKIEITKVLGTPMGTDADYYIMAEMYFADEEALKASMSTPDGKAAAKDVMGFAGNIVYMMIGDVVEG
ncbi:EthD family reductase [Alicyclobacillus dauci]|uniref:EthD family reductase n=1 Tax=Alicyclobacillus dauci TaxID=1475485 RepID=A0ABY6YXD4_9BACL|nr:EthD family reductase [Alicyclobacillus dauci]WAH35176.1 EthD family reductase [Alicyclobacillus dauci]